MKKVLVLTTHFPPSAHVGAKRVAKFCKYLPQYGWEPIVITCKMSQCHLLDETLNDDLPSNIKVYRVGAEGKNTQKNSSFVKKIRRPNLLKSILIKIYDFFVFYDYLWLFQAFIQARRIIRDNDIKVVLSSFPNVEPVLVGLLLKIFLRIKWICEFRDPWMVLHVNYKISLLERKIEKYIEKKILSKSDHLIAVGESFKKVILNTLPKRLESKISVIYNGYDADDFSDFQAKKNGDCFVMTHLGTWGNRRTPEYFLRALGDLLREKEDLRKQIIVEFIGEVKLDPELKLKIDQIIAEEKLEDTVKRIPFMSHKDGLAKVANSDVLLLVTRPPQFESNNHWMVTSKLFECLFIGKPILALVPPEGDTAKIIKRAKAGEIVEPDNIREIQRKIYSMHSRYLEGRLFIKPDFDYIRQFDRIKLTKKLAEICSSLN